MERSRVEGKWRGVELKEKVHKSSLQWINPTSTVFIT